MQVVLPAAAVVYLIVSLSRLPAGVVSAWADSRPWSASTLWLLLLLAVLSFSHWLMEAVKWRLLAGKLEQISLAGAFRGVLVGVSLGMITPKRSGEYAGRALLLKEGNRLSGMVAQAAGSLAQLMVTLTGGMIALGLLCAGLAGPDAFSGPDPWLWLSGAGVFMVLLWVVLWLVRGPFCRYAARPGSGKRLRSLLVVRQLSRSDFGLLLLISAARYTVFVVQFALLLQLFGTPLGPLLAFALLAIIFLVMNFIPVSALAEVGVKGSVALVVVPVVYTSGPYSVADAGLAVTAAVMALWLINLALPALAGALLAMSSGKRSKPGTQ